MKYLSVLLAGTAFVASAAAQQLSQQQTVENCNQYLLNIVPANPISATDSFDQGLKNGKDNESPLIFHTGADCKAGTDPDLPGMSVAFLRARMIWNSIYDKLYNRNSWTSSGYDSEYWYALMPYGPKQKPLVFKSVSVKAGYTCEYAVGDRGWNGGCRVFGQDFGTSLQLDNTYKAPNENGYVCQNDVDKDDLNPNPRPRFTFASGQRYICCNGTGIRSAPVF